MTPDDIITGTAHEIPEPPTDEERIAVVIGNVFEAKFAAAFDAKFGPLAKLMESVLDTLMQVCAAQTKQGEEIVLLRAQYTALESRVSALESHHAACRSHSP